MAKHAKTKIVEILRQAGEFGVTNVELQTIALRYGGLLGELYKDGYIITNEHEGAGVYRYTLIEEPKQKQKHPDSALNILLSEIRKGNKGVISVGELRKLLDDYGFNVVRKGGSHMRVPASVEETAKVATSERLKDTPRSEDVMVVAIKSSDFDDNESFVKGDMFVACPNGTEDWYIENREGTKHIIYWGESEESVDFVNEYFAIAE